MSLQDERELRDRLGSLLYGIEPGPPPVASTMRRGRGIRMRRWISVAAGVAALGAVAIVVPRLLADQQTSPVGPTRYHVAVEPVGPHAQAGLIGQGTTDGLRWTAVMSASGRNGVMLTGRGLPGFASFLNVADQFTAAPATLTTTRSARSQVLEFGTVRADVTSVVIGLPGGQEVSLTPVSWHGRRWVAVLLPAHVPIVRAVLYTSQGELAYAVPYRNTELAVWWRPGQVGPARLTASLGAGIVDGKRWQAVAQVGPWGYCYAIAGGSTCMGSTANPESVRPGTLVSPIMCGSLDAPGAGSARAGLVATAPAVRSVLFGYASGGTATYRTVAVAGGRMFGYVVPAGMRIARSVEYGASGQVLATTSGATWQC